MPLRCFYCAFWIRAVHGFELSVNFRLATDSSIHFIGWLAHSALHLVHSGRQLASANDINWELLCCTVNEWMTMRRLMSLQLYYKIIAIRINFFFSQTLSSFMNPRNELMSFPWTFMMQLNRTEKGDHKTTNFTNNSNVNGTFDISNQWIFAGTFVVCRHFADLFLTHFFTCLVNQWMNERVVKYKTPLRVFSPSKNKALNGRRWLIMNF